MLATFETYRDRILANADEAENVLSTQGRESVARLDALRANQGVVLAAYQLFMHREVFAPMIGASSPATSVAARELKIECITLFDDFSGHARRWAKENPLDRWEDYGLATSKILVRIRAHLAKVEPIATTLLAARMSAGLSAQGMVARRA